MHCSHKVSTLLFPLFGCYRVNIRINVRQQIVYARVEAKIKIPRGPDGVNYVAKHHPELTLITKLIPRPS
jgi:hypothetical protein